MVTSAYQKALAYANEDAAATAAPDPESQFVKGARAGTYGMGSSLRNAVGGVAESLGATGFAQDQYTEAAALAAQAQERGPRVGSLEQLGREGYSLRNMGDYAAGVIGGAAPSLALGVGATLASGGAALPALAAGTAAYAPIEIGDTVAKFRDANPGVPIDGATMARLGGTGVASAGLQSIVPAMVGGKLAGKGLAGAQPSRSLRGALTHNLAEIPLEGATEGGGDVVKQVGANPDAPIDWASAGENAVAGAIGGTPAAGLGAVGDYGHGKANAVRAAGDKAKGLFAKKPKAEGEGIEKVDADGIDPAAPGGRGTSKSAGETIDEDRAAEALARLRTKPDDTLDRISNDRLLGDEEAFAKATPDEALRLSTESDAKASSKVKEWGEGLMSKAGLSEENKAKLSEALKNTGDRANQAFVAGLKKTTDAADSFKSKLKGFTAGLNKGNTIDVEGKVVDDQAALPGAKKSEDYSGAEKTILNVLKKHSGSFPEGVLDDPETSANLAASMRQFVAVASDPSKFDAFDRHWNRAQLAGILGENAPSVMADLYSAVGSASPSERATFYENLNRVKKSGGEAQSLSKVLQDSLPEGATDEDRNAQVGMADDLMAWSRGEFTKDMPPEQARFRDSEFRDHITQTYGDKADQVFAALEQHAADSESVRGASTFADTSAEAGLTEKDAPAAVQLKGLGKTGKMLVTDPNVYRASDTSGLEGSGDRLLKKLQAEHPGASIRFVSAVENPDILNQVPSLKAEMTKQRAALSPEKFDAWKAERLNQLKAEGKGMFEITQEQRPDSMSPQEVEASRMDTGAFGKKENPARLEVRKEGAGKDDPAEHVFDAVALTRVMQSKISRDRNWTKEDDVSDATRAARAFSDGVAALMEQYGRFMVPPKTVIAYIDGKQFTAGDIKKIDRGVKSGRREAGNEEVQTAQDIEKRINELEKFVEDETNQAVPDIEQIAKSEDELERLRPKLEKQSAKESVDNENADTGTHEVDPVDANITKAGATLKASELERKRGDVKSLAKPTNAKPLMLLASRIRESEVPAKEALASRVETLAKNIDMMSAADQRTLLGAVQAKASVVKATVNEIARKYADRIVTPGKGATYEPTSKKQVLAKDEERPAGPTTVKQRLEYLENPPKDYTPAQAQKHVAWAQQQLDSLNAKWKGLSDEQKDGLIENRGLYQAIIEKGKSVLEGDAKVAELEGSPDPKVRAAQVAAPSTKAASGNEDAEYAAQLKSHDATDLKRKATSAEIKDVGDYLDKVLGPKIKRVLSKITHAGDYDHAKKLIRISVHALNPTTVAYHESLHAFFGLLKDSRVAGVQGVMEKAARSPAVMGQLRKLLDHSPSALKQLSDPEEAAAYMYQFWMAGELKLGGAPRTFFEKVTTAIREALGIWSNDRRALHIMQYFSSGEYQANMSKPNAVHAALIGRGNNKAVDAARKMADPLYRMADAVVSAGSERLRDADIPSLTKIADTIKTRLTEEGEDGGYIPAARLARTEALNRLGKTLARYDKDQIADALEQLQSEKPAATPEGRLAAREVKKFLAEQLKYMQDAGVKVDSLGPDYFPRVWDSAFISANQDEFVQMLGKYGINPDVLHSITANDGNEFGIMTERPGMQFAKERVLAEISAEDFAKFAVKDMHKIMNSYVTQASRRAEWARRFGNDSKGFWDALDDAKREGATPEQIETARKYAMGVNGTLGDDIDPSWRRLQGNMIVYQNLRLLPLAIFSSVVDPMGILVRGGEISDAWSAFKRGIREIPKGLRGDTSADSLEQLAMDLGTVDDAALAHDLGSLYGQGVQGDTARRINDGLFRFNLMEQFNRSMRTGATQAALKFIAKHSAGHNQHSERYLRELGIGSKLGAQVGNYENLPTAEQQTIKAAVNRWVDGAVLRPDAADKPIWMNDPHFALIAHLKQFVYSFHHTILKRVVHEARNGNYTPAMALASYVPIMIAADAAKGMLQNGGDEPEWKKGWGMADYVGYGVQRAGLFGVGQFGLDIAEDVKHGGIGLGALGGPTIEQLTEAISVVGGKKTPGSFVLDSMPANAVYSGYVD